MYKFTVIWRYAGNHGVSEVYGNTESHTIRLVIKSFSKDFGQRATLVAVKGVLVFRNASSMLEPAVLARRNDRATIGNCTWFVDQDVVTDEDATVRIRTEFGAWCPTSYTDIKEYLPA